MEFDENNGSFVGKVDVCDADVEIPQDAIRRMGVGFFHPIEEPLVADREGQCSTQVEPSSAQDQQAPTAGETSAPTPQPAEDHQSPGRDGSPRSDYPPPPRDGQSTPGTPTCPRGSEEEENNQEDSSPDSPAPKGGLSGSGSPSSVRHS